MKFKQINISGFKSIGDITIDELSNINVFYGLNNVGKSNIFQALDFWQGFAWEKEKNNITISP